MHVLNKKNQKLSGVVNYFLNPNSDTTYDFVILIQIDIPSTDITSINNTRY